MFKYEIILPPTTEVLLLDLSLTTQVFDFPCHCEIKQEVLWTFEFCRLHGGQFHLIASYWCSLHQASDCCLYFPSFTGTVYHGLLSLCPCITSLKFLSCSPCAVPPFELRSGGAVVPTIASLMSWFSNPKFRGINLTDILWRFLTTSACFPNESREFQGQGWNQPGGIEVSILYRNAVWALQAGICGEALAFKHYTHKWGFGIKVIFLKWPSFSTDHNRGFGPGVRSFEARIAEFECAAPSCLPGRKHPGVWAPILGKVLCVLGFGRIGRSGRIG